MRPSGCTVMARTIPFAPVPTLKLASTAPLASRRARRERLVPFTVRNAPPINVPPLKSTATANTVLSGPLPTWNDGSGAPPDVSRAIRIALLPFTDVNAPPMTTEFDAPTATAHTAASGPRPGLNEASTVPSAFNRPIRTARAPCKLKKSPPTHACPFARNAMPLTGPSAPSAKLKPASTDPADTPASSSRMVTTADDDAPRRTPAGPTRFARFT